jgi:hypothetical protein
MTNNLLAKATALLEARENGTPDQMRHYDDDGRVVIDLNICVAGFSELDDADFYVLAANTSTEIITGYQDLVRRMADALAVYADFPESGYEGFKKAQWYEVIDAGEIARNALEEARAAIPHTSTKS